MKPTRPHQIRFWITRYRVKTGIVISLLILIGSGCKTPDFIGRRYGNFTAYYNGFYNAERVFENGYKNLNRTNKVVDRNHYLPLFVKTTGASASREFEDAVLKSADLLREHPDSKWVDDALLLIGKAYYYQENYVGSTQKFREVIELKSKLEDEGRFWLARSLITSGAFESALDELNVAITREDLDRKWASQYQLLLADLNVAQDDWEATATYLTNAIPDIKDKDLAARAQFLLGQVSETLGRYEEAVAAFEGVREFSPIYELDYAARFSAIRVDGMYVDPEGAIVEARKMERDDKNFDNLAEMRFLRARILQNVGREDEAFDMYDELLTVPEIISGATKVKGRVHYALGELYRDIDRNFVMAAAHFDTAAGNLGISVSARNSTRVGTAAGANTQFTPEAITDATDLRDNYSKYARVFKDIARYDSLLWLGSLPQEEYDAKILELREKEKERLQERRKILEERQRAQAFRATGGLNNLSLNRGLPEGKIIPTLGDPTGTRAGFLFHADPIRAQEGRIAFQVIWGDRPLAPNWRRSAALSTVSFSQDQISIEDATAALEELNANVLPDIDDSAVPRDSLDQVMMRASRAISRYELGNVLFLGMVLPDSAIVWYRKVIEEDGEEPVAQRALYALAEVQQSLGDLQAAERLYRDILVRFPDSDFSDGVRERLGIEIDDTIARDSTELAVEAFELALGFGDGDPILAINVMLGVAVDWVDFEESGRALFAVGDLHLRMADADSAAIFAPLPLEIERHRLSVLWPKKFDALPEPEPLPDSDAMADAEKQDSLTVEPDSLEAPGDIEQESVDSLAVAPDIGAPDIGAPDIGAVVIVDSTAVRGDLPDEIEMAPADSSSLSTPTPPEAETYLPELEERSEAEADLYIEDVYSRLVATMRGNKIGLRSRAILDAIVELRTPPVDTTAVDPMALDSLDVQPLMADSLVMQLVAIAAARADSLAAADSLAKVTGFREVPSPQVPNAAVSDSDEEEPEDEFAEALPMKDPSTEEGEPFEEEGEEEEGRESSDLKPLLPTGRPDLDAEGYSLILRHFFDSRSAHLYLRELTTQLESTGIPLYVITNSIGEQVEYFVGWGMFETKAEGDRAISSFDAILPARRTYLHLLPTTVRRR